MMVLLEVLAWAHLRRAVTSWGQAGRVAGASCEEMPRPRSFLAHRLWRPRVSQA